MQTEELAPLSWTTVQRRVRDLVPLSYNPRILTEEGRVRLMRSIQKFNLAEIPAINTDDVVLAGHQRLSILLDLGRGDEIIDVRMPNRLLTKEELDEYNITSNVGAGIWDYQSLQDNFAHIDLGAIGDTSMLAGLEALANQALALLPSEEQEFDPTPPKEPVSVLGDVYELSSDARGLQHVLVCGSSTDSDVVARALAGKLIDLVNTDPPYNVNYQGKTKDALKIENDSMDNASFREFLYDYYTNCFTFMKPGAPIYVFHADSEGANFRLAMQDAGLKLSQCLVWVKQQFVMGRQDFHWQHEPILYGWKEGAAHTWYSDRKQTTVLNFDRPQRNAEHPTMKPLPILEYLLECSSKPGDVVFDGFSGSGSLLVACEKLDREAHVIELDPGYVDVDVRRWVKFMRDNQRRFTVTRNGEELTHEQLALFE
ncbi:DNA modification methylase [Hymenobacter psychrotolerans]|uniref:Methyltransferase n=1 Tax=Hymenobacter psychrotolerans DSM 18569 TaxID=1121959 RepID=A0A1M6Z847_9BACT|nr:DNA modification methylase [Hymenobacter psychrotolerans]SHL26588.1 site-specific DNA-methyltransferase (adenine-specific) [Hymenobacter psychrotolerans DSM 18569]